MGLVLVFDQLAFVNSAGQQAERCEPLQGTLFGHLTAFLRTLLRIVICAPGAKSSPVAGALGCVIDRFAVTERHQERFSEVHPTAAGSMRQKGLDSRSRTDVGRRGRAATSGFPGFAR